MYSLSQLDGVVFDMDGVIFDTESVGLKAWGIVGARHGIDADVMTDFAVRCIGRSCKDSTAMLHEQFGEEHDADAIRREANEEFRRLINEGDMPIKKGARELLEWLKEKHVKVALASSTTYNIVTEQLGRAGLKEYFSVIIGGDMIENSKPEPEIYLMACERLGVRPEFTLAVEDSLNGIISAHRAGMLPVLVPDIVKPTEEMLGMTYTKADSLCEVLDKLSKTGI